MNLDESDRNTDRPMAIACTAMTTSAARATSLLQMDIGQLSARSEKVFRGAVLGVKPGKLEVSGGQLPTVTYAGTPLDRLSRPLLTSRDETAARDHAEKRSRAEAPDTRGWGNMSSTSRWIHVEPETFDPWRIQAVRHSLMSHPLLQLDRIVELGKRREAEGKVRTHSDQVTAATPFNEAPRLHPNQKSAAVTLDQIEHARAWMSLLDIQADPVYRQLVDDVLDDLRPVVEAKDHRMGHRAGWIFVTSPNAVTPFHMDQEHNFIMQVVGRKRLYVWDPFDREAVSHEGLEKFHAVHSRDLVRFSEELRSRATVFDLEPGMGGYMPSTSPHLVENGDNPSVTVSFTYYTDSTRYREGLYRANHKLRTLGFRPQPVGTSGVRDAFLHAGMRGFDGSKNVVKRLLGRHVVSPYQRYAESVYT